MFYEAIKTKTRPAWLDKFIATQDGEELIDCTGIAVTRPDGETDHEVWELITVCYAYAMLYKFVSYDDDDAELRESQMIGIDVIRKCAQVADELKENVDWNNELKNIEGVTA